MRPARNELRKMVAQWWKFEVGCTVDGQLDVLVDCYKDTAPMPDASNPGNESLV
jgi:hypothetical protein